jgi:L-aspartate oxidase
MEEAPQPVSYYDYILVGSGIAGLYTSLLAQRRGSVLIITKGNIDDCNTRYAQGGIAAPIGENDSPELHFRDTITAGDGLSDEEAARILVNEAPDRIADLVHFEVPFDTVDGKIALTTEAAHSRARILHAGGDATGEHIEVTLSNLVRSSRISVLENFLATDIHVEGERATGIQTLNCRSGATESFDCGALILATGGAGQLYKYNTNSDIATGDGVALAFKAGAEITDMEFFQFHPTALRLPGAPAFLISEAVRGEGGVLRNVRGERFMPAYAAEAELAPRDVVARSIVSEMEKTGAEHVFIDVTHLAPQLTTTRFPHIYRFCLEHGVDITREPVPVAPAAHYMMGGVKVNTWGETNVAGLFATGEVACTGVHGANRLASNSMLEVLVFSKRIIEKAQRGSEARPAPSEARPEVRYRLSSRLPVPGTAPPSVANLQELLWDNVGIVRDREHLTAAADLLATWERLLPAATERHSYELGNMVLTGRLMAEAALLREESRGAHFRTDFPHSSAEWRRHIVFTLG